MWFSRVISLIMVFGASFVYAADAPKPVALATDKPLVSNLVCTPVKVALLNKDIILSGPSEKNTTRVYFIQNKSNKSLWLDHPIKRGVANAGWSSYLQESRWSALAVDRKDFALSCAVIQPGKTDTLACNKSILVCDPKDLGFVRKRKGSYWIVENKAFKDVVAYFKK